MGTPYYWESEFEYRGQTYTVTYSSGFSAFKQTPAYIQHREAQARIDEMLDNPKPVSEPVEIKPIDEQWDEIWKILNGEDQQLIKLKFYTKNKEV